MTISEYHRLVVEALAAKPSEAFTRLQAQALSKHEATGDKNIAILHDAMDGLLVAIFRHDEDFRPSPDDDNDIAVDEPTV